MSTQPNYDAVPGGYAQAGAGVPGQGGVKRWLANWKQIDRQYEQSGFKSLHQELAQYICLGRGRFIDRGQQPNANSRAAQKVVNNVATDALHILGAGLHGGLSSPARPWFKLGFLDPGMEKFRQYRGWLDECEKALYAVFKRSNFYSVIHHLYEEQGGFGTGAMWMEAHPRNIVNFIVFTAGDYRFTVKDDGRTHTLYRYFRMQVAQLAASFGVESLSDRAKRLLQTAPHEWVDVYHVLEPNEAHNPGKAGSFPWTSCYFEANTEREDKRLSYGGYQECPAVTPRWMPLANEPWSWGPGPESLQLVKALQKMELASIKASDKMIDPPTRLPPSMRDRMLDLSPGGKNVVDEATEKIEPIVVINPMAIKVFGEKTQIFENRIRRNFFNDIFMMIANTPLGGEKMTAAEIAAREQEKRSIMGPVVESQEYECLDLVIERTFALAARAGVLPPPPPELQGTEYRVEFVSILAQAQKLLYGQGMATYLGTAERVFMIDPSTAAKTNWDKFLESTADLLGMPADNLRDEDEVGAIRQQAAQAAAEERQLAAGAAEVDAMAKLGKTPAPAEDNALGQMQQAVEE
jgi:hypothetical protein